MIKPMVVGPEQLRIFAQTHVDRFTMAKCKRCESESHLDCSGKLVVVSRSPKNASTKQEGRTN